MPSRRLRHIRPIFGGCYGYPDPTGTEFAEQRDLNDYLRAFRDYLFGDRPEPIDPPGSEPLTAEAVDQLIARQLSGER
ncbi:hypothetical protein [Nocardia sp. NPDC051833]|uniref:hypothetical protein n=1 Tax=Nocardia sp. NPDC051833 TaxID=3155674 RepID=UPI0034213C4B